MGADVGRVVGGADPVSLMSTSREHAARRCADGNDLQCDSSSRSAFACAFAFAIAFFPAADCAQEVGVAVGAAVVGTVKAASS